MMTVSNRTMPIKVIHVVMGTTGRIMLSLADLRIFQIVNHVTFSGTVCLFGIIANVINMILFFKQGLHDTVNMCLFSISPSDLVSLFTLEWVNINLNPFMDSADVPFEPIETQYFTGGWPHACFARITIWITIIVTSERFCCVVFPLKVKQMVKPLRTKVAICVIYVTTIVTLIPEYCSMYFKEKFIPARNQTRIGLIDRGNKLYLEYTGFMMYAVTEIVTFLILIVLTSLLVIGLKRRSDWRKMLTIESQQENTTATRDRRTMKLVSLVAIVVIVCFTPAVTMYFTIFFVPGFNITGMHSIIFNAMWSITFLAEAINSSVNIFILYRMSFRYRQTLHEMLSACQKCYSRSGAMCYPRSDANSKH